MNRLCLVARASRHGTLKITKIALGRYTRAARHGTLKIVGIVYFCQRIVDLIMQAWIN